MRKLLLAAALFVCHTAPAFAEWELLGEKQVDFASDTDQVPVSAREGRFTKIKLVVEGNAVVVDWVKVHFSNGKNHELNPDVPVQMRAGGSHVIDLPGNKRLIKRVSLKYHSKRRRPGRGKATFKVFGERAGADPTPDVDAPEQEERVSEEWVKLGEKRVGWVTDRDKLTVTASEGVFRQVKFRIAGNGIVLDWIKIHFRNGGVHEINPAEPKRIDKGKESDPFDLPGDARIITEIEFKYRTALAEAPRGKAHVKVFGLRVVGEAAPAEEAQRPADQDADDGAWTKLGQKNVGFGVDLDRIRVTASEGRFTKIRFQVTRNAILLRWIKVHFANGEHHQFKPRGGARIEAGSESQAFDLPGNQRIITEIELKYSTPLKRAPRGKANVKVFGKQ